MSETPEYRRGTGNCPCGHPLNDDYLCLNGLIYGPSDHDNYCGCCTDIGECKSLKGCCDEED